MYTRLHSTLPFLYGIVPGEENSNFISPGLVLLVFNCTCIYEYEVGRSQEFCLDIYSSITVIIWETIKRSYQLHSVESPALTPSNSYINASS